MCSEFPLSCALRDGHQGIHLRADQLDAAVDNLASTMDAELHCLLTTKRPQEK